MTFAFTILALGTAVVAVGLLAVYSLILIRRESKGE